MPFPQHTPFGKGSIARAVQAYSFSILNGGTIQQAEAAASLIVDPMLIPQIASMSAAARALGRTLTDVSVGLADPADPTTSALFGLSEQRATEHGGTILTATVAVEIRMPNGDVIWKSFQRDIPLGTSAEQAADLIADQAIEFAEGDEADYPGELVQYDVRTVIGH